MVGHGCPIHYRMPTIVCIVITIVCCVIVAVSLKRVLIETYVARTSLLVFYRIYEDACRWVKAGAKCLYNMMSGE